MMGKKVYNPHPKLSGNLMYLDLEIKPLLVKIINLLFNLISRKMP